MSSAQEKIENLAYRIVKLESSKDLDTKNLGSNYVQLCNNEVTQNFASGLYDTEINLKALKLVEKGKENHAVAIIMYVDPMRAYDKKDAIAKKFTENSLRLGFDQQQAKDAIEILVFCVQKDFKEKEIAPLLLLHAIEESKKKFIVVGQDLGPANEQASNFFADIFGNKTFETKRNKGNVRFYVSETADLLEKLGGQKKHVAKAALTRVRAKKPVSQPLKKVGPASKKRRSTAACGKVVRRSDSFLNSIGKLFKNANEKVNSTLSSKAACILDAIVRETLEKIGEFSKSLLSSRKSKTLDQKTVFFAIRSVFKNGEIAKFMISHGAKAVEKMKENKDKSRAVRAELKISPARVARLLRKSRTAPRYQENVDVFIAGALEYLAFDIIESSLALIAQNKKKIVRLNPRILKLTISGDDDLRPFFHGIIGGGGVMPSEYLEKKQKTKE